jgi:hypothetical protein
MRYRTWGGTGRYPTNTNSYHDAGYWRGAGDVSPNRGWSWRRGNSLTRRSSLSKLHLDLTSNKEVASNPFHPDFTHDFTMLSHALSLSSLAVNLESWLGKLWNTPPASVPATLSFLYVALSCSLPRSLLRSLFHMNGPCDRPLVEANELVSSSFTDS